MCTTEIITKIHLLNTLWRKFTTKIWVICTKQSPHLDNPGPKVNWKLRELIVQYLCPNSKYNKICLSILFDMKDWCKFLNLVTFCKIESF